MGLAIWRVKCYYDTLVQNSTFVLRLSFSAKNPRPNTNQQNVMRYSRATEQTK